MKIMSNKQYEWALEQERKRVRSELFCEVVALRDALSKTSTTKINAFGVVLLLLDPSSGVPYVQPKTRVTSEEHAAVLGQQDGGTFVVEKESPHAGD